jgi:hypothetical protein
MSEKEQIGKLMMLCGLMFEALKEFSEQFNALSDEQRAALPNKYKTTQLALLGVGVMLGDLMVEMGVAERISEEEK